MKRSSSIEEIRVVDVDHSAGHRLPFKLDESDLILAATSFIETSFDWDLENGVSTFAKIITNPERSSSIIKQLTGKLSKVENEPSQTRKNFCSLLTDTGRVVAISDASLIQFFKLPGYLTVDQTYFYELVRDFRFCCFTLEMVNRGIDIDLNNIRINGYLRKSGVLEYLSSETLPHKVLNWFCTVIEPLWNIKSVELKSNICPLLATPLTGFKWQLWDWQSRNVQFIKWIETNRERQQIAVPNFALVPNIAVQIGESKITFHNSGYFSIRDKPRSDPSQSLVNIQVRGGIICDPPSTGKSISIIAAIWAQKQNTEKPFDYFTHCLPLVEQRLFFKSEATLIVCPARLVKQWLDYFDQCLGDRCIRDRIPKIKKRKSLVVVAIFTLRDYAKLSLRDLLNVDVIIVAQSLFRSKSYMRHLTNPKDYIRDNTDKMGDFFVNNWNSLGMLRIQNLIVGIRQLFSETVKRRDIIGVPLEGIFWERIIIDEAHELVDKSSTVGLAPFTCIQSNYTWLLTATPKFQVSQAVQNNSRRTKIDYNLLDLLPISIKHHKMSDDSVDIHKNLHLINTIVQGWCRRSGAIVKRPMYEHNVEITMNPMEQAIYHSNSSDKAQKLLQFCSYHTDLKAPDASNSGLTVAEAGSAVAESREQWIKEFTARRSAAVLRFEMAWDTLLDWLSQKYPSAFQYWQTLDTMEMVERRSLFLNRLEVDLCHDSVPFSEFDPHGSQKIRERHSYVEKIRTESRTINKLNKKLAGLIREKTYFDGVLSLLSNQDSLVCPIHYADIPLDRTMLLSCGHYFCSDCLDAFWRSSENGRITCPSCRCSLDRQKDVRIVDRRTNVSGSEIEISLNQRFGTKIARLVELISNIRQDSNQGKILVFAKWDALLKQIEFALNQLKVETARPSGNIYKIKAEFARFYNDKSTDVLLLSTQSNLSGSHLVIANNIIFVHPFDDEPADAYKHWEQAVSRMQRYGQPRDIHVWYLLSKNTIEESLTFRFAQYKSQMDSKQKQSDQAQAQREAILIDSTDDF